MPWDERDDRKKQERLTASDAAMAERHRGFDLAAQDQTAKFERPQFAVVGEGTKVANDNYRTNYDKIDWSK